ncbi:DISARM system phospholipase D-like protein DrmC [Solwaraspora sp. WMMD937]|uniref:DISARM system phospholipase D-like protein DrmC n=1 Tax=Solwaraspora sp. WMMD937 TaxID=3016090 RepID=UPI002499C525|nr:DISARM system phospholipase D-like protein DrmC [Solwaraspora sp. WMMD937]WFE22624.1 DISARM system phospholipase D-like protein DrmC [Solwaraspora sp. WMMD937]
MNPSEAMAQTVAELAAELPAGHVAAWAGVLASVARPDATVEAALTDARPGYAVAGHARRLVTAWRTHAPGLPGPAVALALRSAAHLQRRAEARRTELVVSGPSSPAVAVRLTRSVVVELIRQARRSLLMVSFAAYGVAEVVAEVSAAADRGVRVDLVSESGAADGGPLRGVTGADVFAGLGDRVTCWHWPVAARRQSSRSLPALHAKVIAADTDVALVSSANLTDRALSDNLEVGVVVRDPDAVRRLVDHFAALTDPRAGVLRRL